MSKVTALAACILVMILLSSCSNFEESYLNTKYDLVRPKNRLELDLINEGSYEAARDQFLSDLEEAELDMSQDKDKNLSSAYNNLCWIYAQLENYELSLEYGKKALAIGDNDEIEYTNYGYALYLLTQTEEALLYFDKAIDKNKNAIYAYYGKGEIYYNAEDYTKALDMFKEYAKYDTVDLEAQIYITYCNTYLKNYEEALTNADRLIAIHKDNYQVYDAKGEVILQSEGFDKAKEFYKSTVDEFKFDLNFRKMYALFLYNNMVYDQALAEYKKLTEGFDSDGEVDGYIIYCYEALDDKESALAYYNKVAKLKRETFEINSAMGNYFYDETQYIEAIEYYDKAILCDPEKLEGYTNKLYALYYGKRYSRCLEAALTALKLFPSSSEIVWFIGESYYYLNDYEKAITYYKQYLEFKPDDDLILSYVGYAYLLMEDYDNAQSYTDQAMKINPDNATAQAATESIAMRQKAIDVQLKDYFKENYLYYDNNMDGKIEKYFNKSNMANSEIAEAIDAVKQEDDIFTFTIFDDDYDYYLGEAYDDVDIEFNDDVVYLHIYSFSSNTYNRTVEGLDQVEDSEQKTLIIDLRNNTGGIAQSATDILDCLLPDCVTCTLIYRDGYTYSYYSSASQIKFEKIIIFVNHYSASASELLTLGLDSYLNNVTIIGTDTFGKGVGQIVYEDSKRKLAIYLVNHYWNVKQQNIMNTSIKPDIYVESDDIADYMNAVSVHK